MAVTWITPAGDLGTLVERQIVTINLSATSDAGDITYSVIAGALPNGLRLSGSQIIGSPTEVRQWTEKRFVVRATDGTDKKDRTFNLTIDGADLPEWITEAGFLNVGQGEAYFVLDNSHVDFQLEANDTDLTAGEVLQYYLLPNSGLLPAGLTLARNGVISGFTQPIFLTDFNNNPNGAYDTQSYDTMPHDIAQARTNGFDSYFYDNVTYDYNEPSRTPKRLSRVYTFGVAVTDGLNVVSRIFKIYVVTEEFLQADNSILQVDTNLFQADSAADRVPFWITDPYLGRWRANNYITIPLDVYDPPSLAGTITYFLLDKNPDGSNSVLPPGMSMDTITGDIAGKVPYQAAVTKNYQFTLQAVNFPGTLAEETYTLVGDWSSTVNYAANQAVRFNGFIYICLQDHRNEIPAVGSAYWKLGVATAERTFNIDIIGEIESAIEWISNGSLGSIKPNQPSKLLVEARSLAYGGRVSFEIINGSLPPGLDFLPTGEIVGKVRQFATREKFGLTRIIEGGGISVDVPYNDTINFSSSVSSFDSLNITFDGDF